MIPDKIYIWNAGDTLLRGWTQKQRNPTSDVEYIRKDALVEWLQQGFDWIKNPVISVQQIIDKLNSL